MAFSGNCLGFHSLFRLKRRTSRRRRSDAPGNADLRTPWRRLSRCGGIENRRGPCPWSNGGGEVAFVGQMIHFVGQFVQILGGLLRRSRIHRFRKGDFPRDCSGALPPIVVGSVWNCPTNAGMQGLKPKIARIVENRPTNAGNADPPKDRRKARPKPIDCHRRISSCAFLSAGCEARVAKPGL